jgi:hypothetical protein
MVAQRGKWVLVALVVVLVAFGTVTSSAWAEGEDLIQLKWAFVAFNHTDDGGELVPIRKDTAMNSGDYFKFFIEKQNPCYIYLAYLSAQGDIHLLYPSAVDSNDASLSIGMGAYVPSGNNWFRLDFHTGEERFYLLASLERLTAMESMFTRLAAAPGAVEKKQLTDDIVSEIRRLRWENRKFKRTAERPVAIMGQLRGLSKTKMPEPKKVSDLAVEIRAEQFYSKAVTIDHR